MAWIKNKIPSSRIRLVSSVIAVMLALLPLFGCATGLFAWFSPFIMLNSAFILGNFVFLNILSFAVLLLIFLKRRFFCIYLCPVGPGCDYISQKSFVKTHFVSRFPDLSRWIAVISLVSAVAGIPLFILLDPMSVFHGFFTALSGNCSIRSLPLLMGLPLLLVIHFLLPGIWCTRLCPLGGIQNIAWDVRDLIKRISDKSVIRDSDFSQGRRYFISAVAGAAAGLLLPKNLRTGSEIIFRPPASVSEDIFKTLCIRCGNCIRACPTNILSHHFDTSDLFSLMTPEVRFTKGYCIEQCNLCSRVCPSGSITLFSSEAKSRIIMGKAEIVMEKCLLLNNRECNRCVESCWYKAVECEHSPTLYNMVVPVIDSDKCVGCGACAVVCPPAAIEMIPARSRNY